MIFILFRGGPNAGRVLVLCEYDVLQVRPAGVTAGEEL